ncbi:unnamed protein product [Phaedon cochleariae]|uniref:RdRp catalytic domain-containing protein n=1 Tax=Phaedon cochleariae TaxID=80249 RepID=A0A9N9X6L1_PHACE|nr:unnamed protein product [Phaedon cochleariae]
MVTTHAHLAGLRDMINSWFDILLYTRVYRNKYEGHNLYEELTTIITLYTDFSKTHSTYHHDALRARPSLVISAILRDLQRDDRFCQSLLKDFKPISESKLFTHLTKRVHTQQEAHLRLEMSGLGKCFGHPIINMTESVKTWISKRSVSKPNVEKMGIQIANTFKLTFCRLYYKEKRVWPAAKAELVLSQRIAENLTNNTWKECSESLESRGIWSSNIRTNLHV